MRRTAIILALGIILSLIAFSLPVNALGGITGAHDLLSTLHRDAVPGNPVLGGIIVGNASPAWQALPPNTDASLKVLTQTGTGAIGAVPSWQTIAGAGGIPATRTLTGGVGIAPIGDLSVDRTISVDTTEIGTTTWGSNADITWTFDTAGANLGVVFSSTELAFQQATTISTVGTLTLDPSSDVIISNTHGLIVGYTSQITTRANIIPELQVLGTHSGGHDNSALIGRWTNNADPARLFLMKSRATSPGNYVIVNDDDLILDIIGIADDGTDYKSAVASIQMAVDGTPGVDDTPGAIRFLTTPDGLEAPELALTIDSTKALVLSNSTRIQSGGVETISLRDTTNTRGLDFILTAAGNQTIATSAGSLVIGSDYITDQHKHTQNIVITDIPQLWSYSSAVGEDATVKERLRTRVAANGNLITEMVEHTSGNWQQAYWYTLNDCNQGSGCETFTFGEEVFWKTPFNTGTQTSSFFAEFDTSLNGLGGDDVDTNQTGWGWIGAGNNIGGLGVTEIFMGAEGLRSFSILTSDSVGPGIYPNTATKRFEITGGGLEYEHVKVMNADLRLLQKANAGCELNYYQPGGSLSFSACLVTGDDTAVGTPRLTSSNGLDFEIKPADDLRLYPADDVIITADNVRITSPLNYIADGGGLVIGSTAKLSPGGAAWEAQILGTAVTDSTLLIERFSADTGGPFVLLAKNRNASIGGNTIVQSGDNIGWIYWLAGNGVLTNHLNPASIAVYIDGTPGAADMPGRIVLSTTRDGAASATEGFRLDNTGTVIVGVGEKGTTAATGNVLRSPDVTTGGAGNVAGTDLTVSAGVGTGTGSRGSVLIQTANAAVAGDNLQTRTTKLTIAETGMTLLGGLWFQMGGGAPAAGDCDAAAEEGRHWTDTTNGKEYICDQTGASTGWAVILDFSG